MSFREEYQDLGKAWMGPRLYIALINPKDIEVSPYCQFGPLSAMLYEMIQLLRLIIIC